MRNIFKGAYDERWDRIQLDAKTEAGHRCIRCHHPFDPATGEPRLCDTECDVTKGIHRRVGLEYPMARRITEANNGWLQRLNYGVHHFDGDKSNNRWWNLMTLCNSCHLTIQATVIPERQWLFEHSEWMKPYVAGFYAYWFAQQLPTREWVEGNLDYYLSLGQPWLYRDATPVLVPA